MSQYISFHLHQQVGLCHKVVSYQWQVEVKKLTNSGTNWMNSLHLLHILVVHFCVDKAAFISAIIHHGHADEQRLHGHEPFVSPSLPMVKLLFYCVSVYRIARCKLSQTGDVDHDLLLQRVHPTPV